jgi:hypothetical protein
MYGLAICTLYDQVDEVGLRQFLHEVTQRKYPNHFLIHLNTSKIQENEEASEWDYHFGGD